MSTGTGRRAVVTGMGVIAPNGIGTDAFWKSVREGISALDLITRDGCEALPLRVAGEVRAFEPGAFVEERLSEYAESTGMSQAEKDALGVEFDLMTVQRKLKDAGRFVFIDRVKNNITFICKSQILGNLHTYGRYYSN